MPSAPCRCRRCARMIQLSANVLRVARGAGRGGGPAAGVAGEVKQRPHALVRLAVPAGAAGTPGGRADRRTTPPRRALAERLGDMGFFRNIPRGLRDPVRQGHRRGGCHARSRRSLVCLAAAQTDRATARRRGLPRCSASRGLEQSTRSFATVASASRPRAATRGRMMNYRIRSFHTVAEVAASPR